MPLPKELQEFLDDYKNTYVVTIIDGNRESWTYLMRFDRYPTTSDIENFLIEQDGPFEEGDDMSFFPINDVMPVPTAERFVYHVDVTKECGERCSFQFESDHEWHTREEVLQKIIEADVGYDDRYGKFDYHLIN